MHDYGQRGRPERKRVVIQTNGILLGKIISLSDLADTVKNLERLSILVHHSLKGSRPVEFHILTEGSAKLFNHQVGLISELVDVSKSIDNFDFQIVFGFFHSDKFILWNPQEDKLMLTEPDSSFLKEIKRNRQRTYVEPLDFRLRMIQSARTIDRSFDKGIVKKISQIPKSVISQLDPIPFAGKKVRISRTFWGKFLLV